MRFIVAVLLLAMQLGSSHAEDITFYHKETDKFWTVFGGASTETGQATCYARAQKTDGSFIEIHRSLVDSEVWAIIHDTDWEIQGFDKSSLRWNFYGGAKGGLIRGGDLDFVVKDKNTILVLQIEPKVFADALWDARYFTLVMPGNISNMSMIFESKGGSTLEALVECIKQNEAKYKNFKPTGEPAPDAVKERL